MTRDEDFEDLKAEYRSLMAPMMNNDLAACTGERCPSKDKCLRAQPSNTERRLYAAFCELLTNSKDRCDHFIDTPSHAEEND